MTTIVDWFGYLASDTSEAATQARRDEWCPFINAPCVKDFVDGGKSGVCTLKQSTRSPVVCCPNRLYGDDWEILRYVSSKAFDDDYDLVPGRQARLRAAEIGDSVVGVFGKSWGGELHLPQRGGKGSYFVDYILARISPRGDLESFVAVEVQSIDTTGNYQNRVRELRGEPQTGSKVSAGFNWENVSKRILPQLIYKGNVLEQEAKCRAGLFFITPKPVYERIMDRLIGEGMPLPPYPPGGNTISFASFDPDWERATVGEPAPLRLTHELTTTVSQVAHNFTGVGNLPPAGSYERAITSVLA
ncbi:MAG: NotI family restriction endonuclease [Brachybacterium tyrofermentans]|uniref:NotI family restriction endonuclease n=1 Tax=Brachybacterium tyrofermentans TaxID=47848 RepID=UPI001866C65D|nr:NotI family restriction endonuclease [Brachybacterium tyrofermentans]